MTNRTVKLNISTSQWRGLRNEVIVGLHGLHVRLGPARLARVRHRDLYKDGRPVETLPLPGVYSTSPGESCGSVVVKLPLELRLALAQLNVQPLLIADYPLTQPIASVKPQGRALSARQISRIIKACNA